MKLFSLALWILLLAVPAAADAPASWQKEWPSTSFARTAVPLEEIRSGGVPKDGIPAIDDPEFMPLYAMRDGLEDAEPVISVVVDGEARAYPLRVMIWHEIVNDTVGGTPVAVTYCPLCNAAIVFDRRLPDGRTLDFGTTGKLRHSDLIMYDRQTESWWQQFTGRAIVGGLVGETLSVLPARLESVAQFAARAPDGLVLVPRDSGQRDYGRNPYAGYEQAPRPFLYDGEPPPGGIPPMLRVVAVGDEAWSLPLLRREREIRDGDIVVSWQAGQASALDAAAISDGIDVGSIVVQREGRDIPHDVTFAFAFFAFNPDGTLHTPDGSVHRPG